jgi:hypothetical protein
MSYKNLNKNFREFIAEDLRKIATDIFTLNLNLNRQKIYRDFLMELAKDIEKD